MLISWIDFAFGIHYVNWMAMQLRTYKLFFLPEALVWVIFS